MLSYVLREIDPALWRQFKRRASAEGHTLKWVLFSLIRKYVSDGL
jgi:hypothetical protein